MFIYDGSISVLGNRKFLAIIVKIGHDEPNYDTIKEYEASSIEEAMIWVDDELSRLHWGKGVWEA